MKNEKLSTSTALTVVRREARTCGRQTANREQLVCPRLPLEPDRIWNIFFKSLALKIRSNPACYAQEVIHLFISMRLSLLFLSHGESP